MEYTECVVITIPQQKQITQREDICLKRYISPNNLYQSNLLSNEEYNWTQMKVFADEFTRYL